MRVAVTEIPQGRTLGIPPPDIPGQRVGRPVRGVNFLRQVPGRRLIGIVAHSVPELPTGKPLVPKEDLVIIRYPVQGPPLVIQLDIVETDPVALGEGMCFPDRICLVAGVPE